MKSSLKSVSQDFPRRQFLSNAMLSAGLFLPEIGNLKLINADVAVGPSEFLPPTAADALSDSLPLISEIQMSVLGIHYTILGKIGRDLAERYQNLRNDVDALQRLVPELKVDERMSEIHQLSGGATLAMINIAETLAPSQLRDNVQAIKISSNRLNQLANGLEIQEPQLLLSPRAVELLRKILQQIVDLHKPTERMKTAANALTSMSNGLRQQIGEIESPIKDAVGELVAAQAADAPPCLGTAKGKAISNKDCANADPSAAKQHRANAIELINKAIRRLETIGKTDFRKDFQTYLEDPDLRLSDSEALRVKEASEFPEVIRRLLVGIPNWITLEKKASSGVGNRMGVMVNSNYVNPSGDVMLFDLSDWIPYLEGIRLILQTIIPEATNDRVRELLKKKGSLVLGLFGEEAQYAVFYDLLPRLRPPNQKDLNTDLALREKAARALAQL